METAWKDIIDYKGLYQINEYGEVKSLARFQKNHSKKQHIEERLLKPSKTGRGYYTVCLCKEGIVRRHYVHILVATHFIDNPYKLPIVNHKNGNKEDCFYKNLEWSTYSENNQHAYDNELKPRGEKFYNARLSEENVIEIIRNGKNDTFQNIADKYGVTKATIRDVLIQRTWKHIHQKLKNLNDYPVRE